MPVVRAGTDELRGLAEPFGGVRAGEEGAADGGSVDVGAVVGPDGGDPTEGGVLLDVAGDVGAGLEKLLDEGVVEDLVPALAVDVAPRLVEVVADLELLGRETVVGDPRCSGGDAGRASDELARLHDQDARPLLGSGERCHQTGTSRSDDDDVHLVRDALLGHRPDGAGELAGCAGHVPPVVKCLLLVGRYQFAGASLAGMLWRVEARPVLSQLVAAVLGGKEFTRGVDCDAYRVANPGNKALGRRKLLPCPVGVVAPDSSSRLELRTRPDAGGVGRSVLDLAGVGRRAEIDVQTPLCIDHKWMHRMIIGDG